MNARPPKFSPPSAGKRRRHGVFRQRWGAHPWADSKPASWFRDNAAARRIVFLAVVAALLGLVYLAWEESRTRSEDWSAGSSLQRNPPAQLPLAGSYVDSRILANGDIRIEHWVRTRTPILEIELVVPHGDGPGGAPRVTDVDVVNELGEQSAGSTVGTSVAYQLNFPSRIVRVRYTLVGAVVRSPSAPGRALARFTSANLVFTPQEHGPEVNRIRAPEVLNLACRAPSQGARPRPCGLQSGTSWQVELRGAERSDQVSAQVDLQADGVRLRAQPLNDPVAP
jgi:hypothetical protein